MPPLLNPSAATFEKNLPPLLIPLYNSQVGEWQIVSDGQYSCGSSGASDIQLKLPDIASEHCRFIFEKQALYLVRVNGRVWVNEIPVAGEVSLQSGDVISLGAFSFQVHAADPLVRPGPRETPRPQILGHFDSPNVKFVGHSDQRFTDAFPRSAVRNLLDTETIDAELQDQRELILLRENEVRGREEAVEKTERQIRQFLNELESMRSDLSIEQQLLKKNRQSLAVDREHLHQQLQQQKTEQDALVILRQQLVQTSQSDSAHRSQLKEQLRVSEQSVAQLEQKHRTAELRVEQLALELFQTCEVLKQRTLATDELRNEILELRATELGRIAAEHETEHQLKTGLEQLEREWSTIDDVRNSQEHTRIRLEGREDALRVQQLAMETQEQQLRLQQTETVAAQQALATLRDDLQREQAEVVAQQLRQLSSEAALQQQVLAMEHQSAELQRLRDELETHGVKVSRERSESQDIAEQLRLREQQLVDQHDDLVALRQKLHDEQEELLQRVHATAERETKLDLQEQSLATRQAQLELQSDSLPSGEHLLQLQLREQAVVSREADLSALEQKLQQQSLAIQESEQNLQQQTFHSEERWSQLRTEECAVQARASEIAERLAIWSTERKSRNARLTAREQNLAQQVLDLQAGTAALKASQKELVAQQQRLATASEQLDIRRQLLQEQHADLAAERDHAIAELTSSRVMIVELRQALEQARTANSRTAELKARLAEQDAMMNQLAESEAAAKHALLKSREEVERLTLLAAENSRTQDSDASDLQGVIDQQDVVIANLTHELQNSRQEMVQDLEGLRRANQLLIEHQVTLQRQLLDAEKAQHDRDSLIRELRNHLATISGRATHTVILPNAKTESPELLDAGTENTVRNGDSSDFYINLGGSQSGSVILSHATSYPFSSEDDAEYLNIDADSPDNDYSTGDDQIASESDLPSPGSQTDTSDHTDSPPQHVSRPYSLSQKADLQTPGALSAELIKLLEMDLQSDGMKERDTSASGLTPEDLRIPSPTEPTEPTELGELGELGVTTTESQGHAVAGAFEDSSAGTSASEIADNEMQQYMDRLMSNLRNPKSSRSVAEEETTSRHTGFTSESYRNKPTASATEITGAHGGKKSPVSYIEQYMSGQRSLDDEPESPSSVPVPQPPPLDQVEALQLTSGVTIYRPKANIQKLRDDMNSIRLLSTRFAEQAIVNHSLKQQQSGLLPRSTAVVASLAILVWLKPYLLLWISFPQYVEWGTLGLLLLSCLELLRKLVVVFLVRFERFAGDLKSRRSTVSSDRPVDQSQSDEIAADDNSDVPLF